MTSSSITRLIQQVSIAIIFFSCSGKKELEKDIKALNLNSGDITLCGSGVDQFGTVEFNLTCSDLTREDFNTATALLHSFEYAEAESGKLRDLRCVLSS